MAAPTRKFASLANRKFGRQNRNVCTVGCATTEKTEIPIDNRIFAFDTGMHACAVRSISVDRTPETGGGGGIRSVGGGNLLNDEHDPNNVNKSGFLRPGAHHRRKVAAPLIY
jgi:hypothetical protein